MMLSSHTAKKRVFGLFIALGVFLALLPVFGFPARIDDRLVFLVGMILIALSFILRRSTVVACDVNGSNGLKTEDLHVNEAQ